MSSPGNGWRIRLTYLWRHRRLPRLDRPRLFTELVQVRKLHDRDARLPPLADKVAVKAYVARLLGDDWIVPTLWHGDALPPAPVWPRPFVIKSRHGCNQTIFVRDRAIDWAAIRLETSRWMRQAYGRWLDEWLYRHIPRGLLVEPYIGRGAALPIDYKFYVFAGRVEYIQVHLDRGAGHRWVLHDRDFNLLSPRPAGAPVRRPATLARMIAAAETLAADIDFVRVDLYEVDGHPLFGEMTFYPGSGLDRFEPVSIDRTMGDQWLRARAVLTPGKRAGTPIRRR